jgi:serine/threonine-protein kinase HipA
MLINRAERRNAKAEERAPRTVLEIDYLLGVNDETRLGALRFATTEVGPCVATGETSLVPPLVELPRLLAASAHVESEEDTMEDIRLLLAPGSSLGGARPKASVRDRDGHLTIAKFPSKTDDYNVVRWEGVALSLARRAGIQVPVWRIEEVASREILLARRFDREGTRRIPFLSAMSMLSAADSELHSYLEIADALRQHGAAASRDLEQLWRRIVFNVLISNTDDHLRNHGFLYAGSVGWSLSPAYDMNPVPVDVKPRFLITAIVEGDSTASLELALLVAPDFGLKPTTAKAIVSEVAQAVATWRKEATRQGLSTQEIDRLASAFEHDDLRSALKT